MSRNQALRDIMEGLKQACIAGNIIEVRKYFSIIKQLSIPLEKQEETQLKKPLVYWAAKAGQLEVLKELIERYECDPVYITERGHTLLYAACARGRTNVARYLACTYGINPNQKNHMNSSPLFAASNNGHLEVMVMLIDELKCNPMEVNSKEESLLHRACGGGHLRVVKCLITTYGLNPEARTGVGDTPLHDACGNGHLIVVQYLIEAHQCEINVFNRSHSTPLHIACRNGHAEVVHYLVKNHRCDKTPYDASGNTPLHLACLFRRKKVVKCMLDIGKVDPNTPNLNGEKPITMVHDPSITTCLIRSGAMGCGVVDVFQRFKEQVPLNDIVRIIYLGESGVGKSTLAQALQMSITTTLGGLITRSSHVAINRPSTFVVNSLEFNSPDFGRVLLYDCAGDPNFNAVHGALLHYSARESSLLFVVVVNSNDHLDDVLREPKKHKEFRQNIRKICDSLRLNNEIDPGCHVLYMLMHEKFGGQICYTIQDVIQEAKVADSYPLPLQASRVCDLAEVLSRRNRILFLRNTKFPQKSLIVSDLNALLNGIVWKIYVPQSSGKQVMSYQNGLVPLSHIKHQLSNVDSSLIIHVLSELKLCRVVSAPDLLSLIRFGRVRKDASNSNLSAVMSFSSPALNLPSHDQSNCEEMTPTSLPYVKHIGVASSATCDGTASIPSSPQCTRARESFSPQRCMAPESASEIKDQVCAIGALAAGSQPILLQSATMKVSNECLPKVMSFHSLQSSSVNDTPFKRRKHRLSTFSLQMRSPHHGSLVEKDGLCLSGSFSTNSLTSSSSIRFGDKCGINNGKERVSLGSHTLLTKQQNVSTNTSDYMDQVSSHDRLLSLVEPKKTVPTRRRSSGVQTQFPSFSNDKLVYLFFPGLVTLDQPTNEVWLHDNSFVWYSGWCIQCCNVHHFFSPWFIQSLILFVTFNFVASKSEGMISVCTQEYHAWKKGLRFLSQNRTETFVELVDDGKAVVVLIRSVKGAEMEGVELRSSLIKAVFDIKQSCSSSIPTSEYFIDPNYVKDSQGRYPIIYGPLSRLARYDIQDIVETLVQATCGTKDHLIKSADNNNVKTLSEILGFDSYMHLCSVSLQTIFDEERQEDPVTEDVSFNFAYDYSEYAEVIWMLLIRRKVDAAIMNSFAILKRYQEKHFPLKITRFRQDLDRYSIFAGRNIFYLRSSKSKPAIVHNREHIQPHINCGSSLAPTKTTSAKMNAHIPHGPLTYRCKTYFCNRDEHTVRNYLHCAENLAPVPFIDQVKILEFDSSGRKYKSHEHGITISIPDGAISCGEIVHFEVAVALYGPFRFDDDKRPISPILWLCPQEEVILLKPITIVLPLTITDLSPSDTENFGISFAKADHSSTDLVDGKQKYVFKQYKQDLTLHIDKRGSSASMQVDHCCFWCLQMNRRDRVPPDVARQMAMKMGFFVHCIECLESPYPNVSPPRDIIYFCVSYFLETCIKAVEDQFPLRNSEGYLIHRIHTRRLCLKDPHLQLSYSSEQSDSCDIAISDEGKIYVSSIDFWESHLEEDELQLMHKTRVYPPRIEMTVQILSPEKQHIKLSVKLEGCKEMPKFQILLPFESISGCSGQRRRSEVMLSSGHLTGSCAKHLQKSKSCMAMGGWKYNVAAPSIPHKDDKPTLKELRRLGVGCTKVTVLKSIASKWRELAIEMGYDYCAIESVNLKSCKDPQIAAYDILGQWLTGVEGLCSPVTWSTLIECISNIECQSVADKLNDVLLD